MSQPSHTLLGTSPHRASSQPHFVFLVRNDYIKKRKKRTGFALQWLRKQCPEFTLVLAAASDSSAHDLQPLQIRLQDLTSAIKRKDEVEQAEDQSKKNQGFLARRLTGDGAEGFVPTNA